MPVTKTKARELALSFPGTLEKPSYGKPAVFVASKFFIRIRAEDGAMVLPVEAMEQRDMLLELDPKTYFITDHYRSYPCILVRLSQISAGELKVMLERRWQRIAPKSLLRLSLAASNTTSATDAGRAATGRPARRARKTHRDS